MYNTVLNKIPTLVFNYFSVKVDYDRCYTHIYFQWIKVFNRIIIGTL